MWNIAILSKSDLSGGGASRVAQRLADLLIEDGHHATHFVSYYVPPKPVHMQLIQECGSFTYWNDQIRQFSKWMGLPEFLAFDYRIFRSKAGPVDLLHVHDISSAFSPWSLGRLAREIPVVWTFHDCSPFTGGCLYPMECTRYRKRCGKCPQLGQWPLDTRFDWTGYMQDTKLSFIRDVCCIAPSQWMADMAMETGRFLSRPTIIPYSIDLSTFQPSPRCEIRNRLQLPLDAVIVCFSSTFLWNSKKGAKYFVEAIRRLKRPNLFALVIGKDETYLRKALEGIPSCFTGFVHDFHQLAEWYSAADFLVMPTIADNLPNSIIETMSCGVPSIAFATGGVVDLIDHDGNGWLAPTGNLEALIEGIRIAIEQPDRRQRWAAAGIEKARQCYNDTLFMQRHYQIYSEVVSCFKKRKRKNG